MEHIQIFGYLVILISSGVTLTYLFFVKKSLPDRLSNSLIGFILAMNLIVFIDLASVYSCVNVLENCTIFYSTSIHLFLGPLSSLLAFFMTLYFLKIIFYLTAIRIHKKIAWI